jgi:tetratricopeptide (TPR) repeat protein
MASADSRDVGALAYEVGTELWAHGDSSSSQTWFRRAYSAFASESSGPNTVSARWGRARAAARLGRLNEALEFGEALAAEDPIRRADYLGFLGLVAVERGDRQRARALLDQLAADLQPYTFARPQFQAGRIAVALGDLDRASQLLGSAYSRGFPFDMDFHRDPALARLRGSMIFRQLDARGD